MPMLNEECFALGAGVAAIADIDAACQLGLNHPIGPLTRGDCIGLDKFLEFRKVLYHGTDDRTIRTELLLSNHVEADWYYWEDGRGGKHEFGSVEQYGRPY